MNKKASKAMICSLVLRSQTLIEYRGGKNFPGSSLEANALREHNPFAPGMKSEQSQSQGLIFPPNGGSVTNFLG